MKYAKLTSKSLKDAIRQKFSWPGGYKIFGHTSDGGVLCTVCMRKEFRNIIGARLESKRNDSGRWHDQWDVIAIDSSANLESEDFCLENPDSYSIAQCNHCYKTLNG